MVWVQAVNRPSRYARHGQRHDQRVDPEDGHAHAVGAAGQQPHGEAHQDGDQRAVGRLVGGHIGRAGGDHGDGEIDAAGEHEDRLRAGQDGQRRGLEQRVAHAALRQKVGLNRAGEQDEADEHADQDQRRMLGHEESACADPKLGDCAPFSVPLSTWADWVMTLAPA